MIQHNQEIAQLSPDPFPLLRVGSGDETNTAFTLDARFGAAGSGYPYRAHRIPVRTHVHRVEAGAIDL